MSYDFALVDVFTEDTFGGNQLAVLTDARELDSGQMQAIAREFNFAETAFVLPAEQPGSTARLRIFTPNAELPFAGHPTVGAAAALARLGLVPLIDGHAEIVFEEQVGPVAVAVSDEDERLHGELTLNATVERPVTLPDKAALAAVLSVAVPAVIDAWYASVGLRFCFCQLATDEDVDRAVLDKSAWSTALGDAWAQNLYFFSGELVDGASLYARMFAPGVGVDEDPATGSACAALAGVAAGRDARADHDLRLTIRQGFKINRPSVLTAGACTQAGRLSHVSVGGKVTLFATGSLDVPPPGQNTPR